MKVMLDIETLSSKLNAAIISIGAVKFDKTTISPEQFYLVIQPESIDPAKFHINPATVYWWLDNKKEVQEAITKAVKVPLEIALDQFASFVQGCEDIWSYGATFDLTIMRHAYDVFGKLTPWSYRQERCFRTLKALADDKSLLLSNPAEHNALADALYQAQYAQLILP